MPPDPALPPDPLAPLEPKVPALPPRPPLPLVPAPASQSSQAENLSPAQPALATPSAASAAVPQWEILILSAFQPLGGGSQPPHGPKPTTGRKLVAAAAAIRSRTAESLKKAV